MKKPKIDLRTVQGAHYFPRLKRGHRAIDANAEKIKVCSVKECDGNHFQNPTEQAARWLEQNGQT